MLRRQHAGSARKHPSHKRLIKHAVFEAESDAAQMRPAALFKVLFNDLFDVEMSKRERAPLLTPGSPRAARGGGIGGAAARLTMAS